MEGITYIYIPKKMEELGLKEFRMADSSLVTLRYDASCIVGKKRMAELCTWLEKKGRKDLTLKRTDTKKLKKFMQEQKFLGGEMPPEEIMSYVVYRYAKITA